MFAPDTQTRVVTGLLTVAGELGSPATWQVVPGFATGWYAAEGNYDLVGNTCTGVVFARSDERAAFPLT